MAKMHNKKRNVGIIYEQIVNFVCEKMMNDDNSTSEEALKLIKKHFKKDSQLFKEYKLFKALATTHGVTDYLASSIITEAKKACNNMFDSDLLEKQKSDLIRDLNYTFGKGVIFEQKVKDYRIYATIQTLLNEWRKELSSFDKVTEYEINLHESLTNKNTTLEKTDVPKVDKLTRQIMKEMFNKKYNSQLNESQRELIALYIKDDEDSLLKKYKAIKSSVKITLENYIKECNNNILLEKYNSVNNKVNNLPENDLSKQTLQKYLTVTKLKEELLGD